ncbi:hypothetical protein [Rubrobacter indicoceani]|uniref:hypothetical protein n=1 Tax=Rubrobacter indicoceani TaxID=2051957 RepID=UPI000E5C13C1|nr:hypothetical protein [Rubrobacter indicoceani]
MSEGSTRFILGTAVGAIGGFVVGSVAVSPATRTVGHSVADGLKGSARIARDVAAGTFRRLGFTLESGYTKVRGREAYLEHEIEELREKISDLESRLD